MRVLVTADLHYDIARSRESARRVADQACTAGGDALVLVGDTAGADLGPLRECLALFERFAGRKLLVPGNHCLWCRQGEDSLHRYEHVLPEAASEAGFAVLDHSPVATGPVGLVGSVGWYDYSLADESLGIPEDFYRAKVAPGAAACLEEHRELLERHRGRLTDEQLSISSRWMDGQHVRLPVSDGEFVVPAWPASWRPNWLSLPLAWSGSRRSCTTCRSLSSSRPIGRRSSPLRRRTWGRRGWGRCCWPARR